MVEPINNIRKHDLLKVFLVLLNEQKTKLLTMSNTGDCQNECIFDCSFANSGVSKPVQQMSWLWDKTVDELCIFHIFMATEQETNKCMNSFADICCVKWTVDFFRPLLYYIYIYIYI